MGEVAVIIPCYSEPADRVRRTVESARAVRNVTRVIVVDDGCGMDDVDGAEVIRLPENRGCSAALNAGIELLADDAIACRLDVGDVFYPDAKARQIDAVLGGARCSSSPHFDPVSGETWKPPALWRRRIYTDSMFTGCTNVYRKDVWREVGGHDESLRYAADWDFSMKVEFYIGWHMHDEPTCEAGMHPGGFTDRSQRDPELSRRRDSDQATVRQRGLIFSHPDRFAHLWNPEWCAKRGIQPLRARR